MKIKELLQNLLMLKALSTSTKATISKICKPELSQCSPIRSLVQSQWICSSFGMLSITDKRLDFTSRSKILFIVLRTNEVRQERSEIVHSFPALEMKTNFISLHLVGTC